MPGELGNVGGEDGDATTRASCAVVVTATGEELAVAGERLALEPDRTAAGGLVWGRVEGAGELEMIVGQADHAAGVFAEVSLAGGDALAVGVVGAAAGFGGGRVADAAMGEVEACRLGRICAVLGGGDGAGDDHLRRGQGDERVVAVERCTQARAGGDGDLIGADGAVEGQGTHLVIEDRQAQCPLHGQGQVGRGGDAADLEFAAEAGGSGERDEIAGQIQLNVGGVE